MTAVVTATVPVTIDVFMREHIRQLQGAGLPVVVVSSPGANLDHVRDAFPDVMVEEITMRRSIAPASDLRALLQWVRLLRRVRPEMIFVKTPKASLLSMLAGWLCRVPRRVYATGGLRLEGTTGQTLTILTLMERLTCWASSEVVANSPSLCREYLERRLVGAHKLRWTLSGQGVDSGRFSRGLVEPVNIPALGLDPALPVVGFIGRITADKGLATLIQAWKLAGDSTHQLVVVGPQDEPDSGQWVRELRALGSRVAILETERDVRPIFEVMDLLVLPSLREGFPNVVLEAAAMEVPTITTDATGCVDSVIDGETGLIVPVGDAYALASAISRLTNDPGLRAEMGRSARERVIAEFQSTTVVKALIGLGRQTGRRR